MAETNLSSFIWSVADLLRGDYKPHEYGRVILPLTVLMIGSIGIIAIHTLEIWLWALIYLELGTFSSFEDALYFSTVTYASIGYGDLLLPHQWRIFGAIEGAAGIIMLGISTAYLVSLLTRVKLFSHDWLTPEGGE